MIKERLYKIFRAIYLPVLFLLLLNSAPPFSSLQYNASFAGNLNAEAILGANVDPVSTTIQSVLASDKLGKDFFKDRKALEAFYKGRGFEPVWVRPIGVTVEAHDLYRVIEKSWTHGLNPNSYHFDKIKELIDAGPGAQMADLELVMADAYIRLGKDLSGIRVDPSALNTSREFWKQSLASETLLQKLGSRQSVKDIFEDIAPKGMTYKRIQEALIQMVNAPAPPYEAVLPIRLEVLLRPYDRHRAVELLRVRLGVRGAASSDPYVYDDSVVAAVIQFQRDHGLKPDGIIGSQTLDLLNIKRDKKLNQLIANLERLRWVDEARPDTFIVVNIPSATLWAIENNRVAFEMPVIVGRQKRETNIFITEIHGVRFNPNWTVPPTIKKQDILPKLQENPAYLKEKGMELIKGHGSDAVSVDSESIDWANLSSSDLRSLRMVQTPGEHNPLGKVRVLMPNKYNIYLHDTNHPEYFNQSSRALSSGCIRLQEPERVAEFIMKHKAGWDYERMSSVLASGKMSDQYISNPIPVYLLYYTVWINDEGELVYGSDLYNYDEKLIKTLSKLDGIFIPVDNA